LSLIRELVLVSSLTLLASRAHAETVASADSSQAVTYIRGRLAQWVEQNNKGDKAADEVWARGMEGWYSHGAEYGDSAAFVVAGVPYVKGAGSSTYDVKVEEVAVGGDVAAVHDIWTEIRHFKGSTATAKRIIRGSELWRRQSDGKWRIVRFVDALEHWTKE
jgi:hypothetical protein